MLICHNCCDLASAMFFCPSRTDTSFWQLTIYQFRPTRCLRVRHGDIDSTLTGIVWYNRLQLTLFCFKILYCQVSMRSRSRLDCRIELVKTILSIWHSVPRGKHSRKPLHLPFKLANSRSFFRRSIFSCGVRHTANYIHDFVVKSTFLSRVLFFVPGNLPGNFFRFDGSKTQLGSRQRLNWFPVIALRRLYDTE